MALSPQAIEDARRRGIMLPGMPEHEAAPGTAEGAGSEQPPEEEESFVERWNPLARGGMLTPEGWELGKAGAEGFRESTAGQLTKLAGGRTGFQPSSFPEKVASGIGLMAGSPIAATSMAIAPMAGPLAPLVTGAGFGGEAYVRTRLAGGSHEDALKAAAREGAGGAIAGLAGRYVAPGLLPETAGAVRKAVTIGGTEAAGFGVGSAPIQELEEHGVPSLEQVPAAAGRVAENVAEQTALGAGMMIPMEAARVTPRAIVTAARGRQAAGITPEQVGVAPPEGPAPGGTGGGGEPPGPPPPPPPGAPGGEVEVVRLKGPKAQIGRTYTMAAERAQKLVESLPDEYQILGPKKPPAPPVAPGAPPAAPPGAPPAPAVPETTAPPPAPPGGIPEEALTGLQAATTRKAVRGGEIEVMRPPEAGMVTILMPSPGGGPRQLMRAPADAVEGLLQANPGSEVVRDVATEPPTTPEPAPERAAEPATQTTADPQFVRLGLEAASQGEWPFDLETGVLDWRYAQRKFRISPEEAQAVAAAVDAQLDREQLTELPGGGNAPEPGLPGAVPGEEEVPPTAPEEPVPPPPPGAPEPPEAEPPPPDLSTARGLAERMPEEERPAIPEEPPPLPEEQAPATPPQVPWEPEPPPVPPAFPELEPQPPPAPPEPPPAPAVPRQPPDLEGLRARVNAADAEATQHRQRGGLREEVQETIDDSVDAARQGLIELSTPQIEEGRVERLDPEAIARRVGLIEESLKLAQDLPRVPEAVQALLMGETPGAYFERGEGGRHEALDLLVQRYPERLGLYEGETGDVVYRKGMFLTGEGQDLTQRIFDQLDQEGRLHEVADLFQLPVSGVRPEPEQGALAEPEIARGRAGRVIPAAPAEAPGAAQPGAEAAPAPEPGPFAGRRATDVARSLVGKRVRFTGRGGAERTGYVTRELAKTGELQINTGKRGPQGKPIYTRIRPEQILGEAESLSGPVLEGVARRGFPEKLAFRDIEAEEARPARRAAREEEAAEEVPEVAPEEVTPRVGAGRQMAALIAGRARRARPEEAPTVARPESEQPPPGATEAPPEVSTRRIPQDQWDFRPGDVATYKGRDYLVYGQERNHLTLIDPDNPAQPTSALFTEISRVSRPGTGESAEFTPEAKAAAASALGRLAEREAPRRGRAGVVEPGPAITAPERPAGAGAPERPARGGRQPGVQPTPRKGRGAVEPSPAAAPLRPVAKGIAGPVLEGLQKAFPLGRRIIWGREGIERGTVIGYRPDPQQRGGIVVRTDAGKVTGIMRESRPRLEPVERAPTAAPEKIGFGTEKSQAPRPEKPQLTEAERARRPVIEEHEARSQQQPAVTVPGPKAEQVRYTKASDAASALRHQWVQGRLRGGQEFHGLVSGKSTDRYVELWYGRDPNSPHGYKSRWVLPESIEYRLPRSRMPAGAPTPEGREAAPITGTRAERRARAQAPEPPEEALWPPEAGLSKQPPSPPKGRR